MREVVKERLYHDKRMHEYLKDNSEWYKYLNRNPKYYGAFLENMKDKYKLRPTDKIKSTIDNIDLIRAILKNL